MKKILWAVVLMSFISLSAFAAKYKVNTSGTVTSSGKKVQSSLQTSTQNLYNNYQAQPYIAAHQAIKNGIGTIDIVMDYSGSMSVWIDAAKRYMSAIISQLPATTKVGFRVFGNDRGNNPYTPVLGKVKSIVQKNGKYKVKAGNESYLGSTSGSCSATSQIAKVAQGNAQTLAGSMNSIKIGGSTPLTLALEQAVNMDFALMSQDYPKKIILITDGGENCGGDPCAFAKNLVKKRNDIIIDVVLVSSNSRELKCLSDITKGKFYNPIDVPGFVDVIQNSMEGNDNIPAVQPQKPEEPKQQYEFVKD